MMSDFEIALGRRPVLTTAALRLPRVSRIDRIAIVTQGHKKAPAAFRRGFLALQQA
jgi:hypothetical protein